MASAVPHPTGVMQASCRQQRSELEPEPQSILRQLLQNHAAPLVNARSRLQYLTSHPKESRNLAAVENYLRGKSHASLISTGFHSNSSALAPGAFLNRQDETMQCNGELAVSVHGGAAPGFCTLLLATPRCHQRFRASALRFLEEHDPTALADGCSSQRNNKPAGASNPT